MPSGEKRSPPPREADAASAGAASAVPPGAQPAQAPAPVEHLTCPICLGTLTDAVGALCGHAYCAECLLGMIEASTRAGALNGGRLACPVCRADLRGVHANYALRGATDVSTPRTAHARDDAIRAWMVTQDPANARPSATSAQQATPARAARRPGATPGAGTVIVIFVLLLYIVSPIDLLPDFIPVVGQLDDVAALVAMLRLLWMLLAQ